MKTLDLLLWGATGFTGRLVAEYLVRHAPPGFRWAIGGRNRDKLQRIRDELGTDIDLVLGDALDRGLIDAAVRRTRVVASTAGPFAQYGTPMVEACADQGVDYCDITGETQWIRGNIDRFHQRAVESGARIVHSCAFDSIPSDLGVWMLHEHLKSVHGRGLGSASFFLMKSKGGFSGGTVASMLNLMEQVRRDPAVRGIVGDPYALNPEGQREGPDRGDQRSARLDRRIGLWTAPFLMAGINTRIVRRSNALLGYPYGKEFRYNESVACKGKRQAKLLSLSLAAGVAAGLFGPSRWLMRKFLPSSGQGPSAEEREAGFFEVRLEGRSAGPEPIDVRGRVRGERDPGYGETSRMFAESAMCLALDDLPSGGGILTPASCMGTALLTRLRNAGMTFEVGDSD